LPSTGYEACHLCGKMRIFTRIYIRILHVGTTTDPYIRILPLPVS